VSDAALISAVFVGVLFAFYLMFLRPIQKEQERHKQQIRDLKPGDQVLTTAGFIGRVKDIQVPESGRTRIYIQIAEGVIVEAVATAIAQRIEPRPAEGAAADDSPDTTASKEQRGLAR
jgi:preprotein translocase subunit YajC